MRCDGGDNSVARIIDTSETVRIIASIAVTGCEKTHRSCSPRTLFLLLLLVQRELADHSTGNGFFCIALF
jgi:hypothetical protein